MDEKALLLAAAWYLVQCPENVGSRWCVASFMWLDLLLKCRQIVASLPVRLIKYFVR